MSKQLHLIEVCDHSLSVSTSLRFLGVRVLTSATFAPWRDSYDSMLHALMGRLRDVGLGATPAAFVKGLRISVLPAVLFGCEIWGIDEVYQVLYKGHSPFNSPTLKPILKFVKRLVGLPPTASNAHVCQLFGLPTFLSLVLGRM